MVFTGEKRIVVCMRPADIYAERKAWNHSGTADRIDSMQKAFFDDASMATGRYSSLTRAYAAFAPSDAESVVEVLGVFVNRCAASPNLPDTAIGVALGYDQDGIDAAGWRPSLRSGATCIADALADIAGKNQVLTDGAFRAPDSVADQDQFVTAPAEVADRVIVALARRIEVAVLNTSETVSDARIANYPVLRPYLKAIEDDVSSLFQGVLDDAASYLPELTDENGKVTPFKRYLSRIRYIDGVLRDIETIFETTDLRAEDRLRQNARALHRASQDHISTLKVHLDKNHFAVSAGTLDGLVSKLTEFKGDLSERIREGDAVRGQPPFFVDLTSTWA